MQQHSVSAHIYPQKSPASPPKEAYISAKERERLGRITRLRTRGSAAALCLRTHISPKEPCTSAKWGLYLRQKALYLRTKSPISPRKETYSPQRGKETKEGGTDTSAVVRQYFVFAHISPQKSPIYLHKTSLYFKERKSDRRGWYDWGRGSVVALCFCSPLYWFARDWRLAAQTNCVTHVNQSSLMYICKQPFASLSLSLSLSLSHSHTRTQRTNELCLTFESVESHVYLQTKICISLSLSLSL